jgi:hypothetical protein
MSERSCTSACAPSGTSSAARTRGRLLGGHGGCTDRGGFQSQRARIQPRAHCAGRAWAPCGWQAWLLALYAVLLCRWTAAAAGQNNGKITAHDFLDRCSWGSPEGGWDCETGEGGEARMSSEWLGGDRLAATGLMDAGRGDSHLSAFASGGPSRV